MNESEVPQMAPLVNTFGFKSVQELQKTSICLVVVMGREGDWGYSQFSLWMFFLWPEQDVHV